VEYLKLFPVAERELRVASRRSGTYWARFTGAALGIGAVAFVLLSSSNLRPVDQSQILFVTLSILAFVYCLLSGVLTTSDCVSEERRDGTLGLLFLTHLRGYDVVVGKMAASSARAVCAVVALMPVIALPILMGGVSGQVVWMTVLVLANTLFVSLTVGVLVSSLTREARHSIGGAFAVLVFWVGVMPLTRTLWIEYGLRGRFAGTPAQLSQVLQWVLDVNPVFLFAQVLDRAFRGGLVWGEIWWGLGIQHALGWALLGLSCVVLPRSWRDAVESRERTGKVDRAALSARRRWRGELLDWHPFVWIVARDRRASVATWLGLSVVAGVWTWGFLEVKEEWLAGMVGLWTTFSAGLWLKLRVAALACRHLHEHRRSGALELVLSTPMTPGSLVRGNLLGIRHLVIPPMLAVLAGATLLWVASLGQEQAWSDRTEIPITFGVGVGLLVLDVATLAWSGMWRGLKSNRYVRAYATTVGMVLFLPWVLFTMSSILVGVMVDVLGVGGAFQFEYLTMLFWWALISVGVNAWQWVQARAGLAIRFRELAAEPYGMIRVGARKPL